jgi:uncharacterized protein (TIGR02147 family)
MWQDIFRRAVRDGLEQIQKNNSRVSARAYAKRIGLSAGALNEILAGKRAVSPEKALAIVEKLALSNTVRTRLVNAIQQPTLPERSLLSARKDILTDWAYLAILHFFDTDILDKSAASIAARLSLKLNLVEDYIRTLYSSGLLKMNADGTYYRDEVQLKTSDDISSEEIQKFHLKGLELAAQTLLNRPLSERDFTSIVLAGNSKNLPAAKTIVRDMYRQISPILSEGPRDQVYRLAVCLFPLTNDEPLK